LQGKIAIAYIGGKSESELNENRDKLIDSLNATKNTLKFGMLPGGGTAFAHATKLLESLPYDN
jgi:chaperonin GroEL